MRSVVVTGASRGLGLGIAETLVASGFRVIAIARQEGSALPALRGRTPDDALAFQACDLAELDALPALAKTLRRRFGVIHGLVNNAGIAVEGLLATMPDAAIARVMRINVTSPMILTKYLLRPMMAAGAGRVVNLASVIGNTGYAGLAAYAASKAALLGFTRSLAREVGPLGITVNAVAPGFVETAMTEGLDTTALARIARRSALRRLPEVADVAQAVDFLMSDRARNITGTVLTVDAGNTA